MSYVFVTLRKIFGMKLKKYLFLIVLLAMATINVFAVPADKTPITIKQPNGKMLTFILQGDERISWAKTLDDYSLLTNKNGNWVYAMIDKNGNMIASDVLACNKEERSKKELKFLKNIKPNLFYSKNQVDIRLNRKKEQSIQPQKAKKKKCCIFGNSKDEVK